MRLAAALAVALGIGFGAPTVVHADGLPELAARLENARSEKARIAAAVSLGRMRDPRALRPLVKALRDDSSVVRAVAASALGHLGDARALPALRRATSDADRTVRKRANASLARIQAGRGTTPRARRPREQRAAHYRIAGRESPRLSPRGPELFVVVKSATDETKARLSKKTRQHRAAALRDFLLAELDANRSVTLSSPVAQERELSPYAVDLSIVKLDRELSGPYVEMVCEVRVAISNERGKMISILTGGAKVQVPRKSFRRKYETQMKKEALENAVKSVHQDLITYLRKHPS